MHRGRGLERVQAADRDVGAADCRLHLDLHRQQPPGAAAERPCAGLRPLTTVTARPITFLSDYGSADEFAGICRAVIARIAPDARVIDLSHGIARHDVGHGAAVLAHSLGYAPPGVHLAVVDPGVGTARRPVAVA